MTRKGWLPELEGLRGLASVWVFIGHIAILTECRIPILGEPTYGVDLFILLSGFLMTKNYIERQDIEPWIKFSTMRNFWIRRFFRIAPLYYILLAIAIYFGPYIGNMREIIADFYPQTATDVNRFSDQSVKNIMLHLSFIFGVIPDYSFRTTLPDWSIGLETQYYLIFPFIMIAAEKFGMRLSLLITSILSTFMFFIFPDFFKSFHMPSFILIKLPIFIAGMLVYMSIFKHNKSYLALAIFVIIIASTSHIHINTKQLVIQIILCAFIFYIVNGDDVSKQNELKKQIKRTLNNKFSVWLGDVSYSVYLIHLLIVTPVCAFLLNHSEIHHEPAFLRLFITSIICFPIVYSLSYISYLSIEKPCIKIGKKIINTFN
ncbi:acyltransferase [Escherichia coli]|uniref:acyltransferase family protein n=1 Tax=Escherichia coli TaxID=562 RepID=UPI00050BA7A6|nr:acyltransferase [Escherichia coli]EEW3510580.1 acyltransferase [Escherichia coli O156:H25]AQZ88855.1 acyltransferase [Escherichia coli]EEC7177857.1 acyltransferase [Escherichia coli]EEC8832211.1 acyltransferase [Escherichia coli]EEC8932084.1 acyltransferase [Escherichia coli]